MTSRSGSVVAERGLRDVHDEHFLERLTRLDHAEVGDALALYHDAGLVRQLLAYAKDRGHEDRIAISVDDPVEGPFIVVTQGGAFVTALGRGMSVGALPIVPRAVWDAARRDHERVQEGFARARELSDGKLSLLGRELGTGGPWVSRELMEVMLAIGKLIEDELVRHWVESYTRLAKWMTRLAHREQWRGMTTADFEQVGRSAWSFGHHCVLVACGGLRKKRSGEPFVDGLRKLRPGGMCALFGVLGPLARAIWMAGKLDVVYFDSLKADYRAASRGTEPIMFAAQGLAAIGSRFSKYRGEVKKLLWSSTDDPQWTRAEAFKRAMGRLAVTHLHEDVSLEAQRAALIEHGREEWMRIGQRFPPGHRLHFAAPQDVPEELALPAVAMVDDDVRAIEKRNWALRVGLPATALLRPEELYLPRWCTELLGEYAFAPAAELAMTRRREIAVASNFPQVRAPQPGRNEACGCGSGKKYKRCCGA